MRARLLRAGTQGVFFSEYGGRHFQIQYCVQRMNVWIDWLSCATESANFTTRYNVTNVGSDVSNRNFFGLKTGSVEWGDLSIDITHFRDPEYLNYCYCLIEF